VCVWHTVTMVEFRRYLGICLVALLLALATTPSRALEIVVTNPQKSALDKRFDYPFEVLRQALERSRAQFGDFEMRRYPEGVSRKRALAELEIGTLTVFSAPTHKEWEARALPIRIPIRKGIMGYRLLLIRTADQDKFATINSVDDLRRFRLGQGLQWSSAAAFRANGFTVHGSTEYEALFSMLMHDRFDYFPRTLNEVFTEFNLRKVKFPDMRIENTIALHMPLPYYFFVTPKRPDLAKRLTGGLQAMVDDGSLDKLFYDFHGADIESAKLGQRRILNLPNPELPPETPLDRTVYWFNPGAGR
jgi:hypothetical protein